MSYEDDKPPLNPLAIYMNAIDLMYRISTNPMRQTWLDGHWALPNYDVIIRYSSTHHSHDRDTLLQTRFILWALEKMSVALALDGKWKPFSGLVRWQGLDVGLITFQKKGHNDLNTVKPTLVTNRTATLDLEDPSDVQDSTRLVIRHHYQSRSLVSIGIFTTVILGISQAVEAGLDNRRDEVAVHGLSSVNFTLVADKDRFGNVQLKNNHIRQALKRTAFDMVAKRRFSELLVVLELDGTKIAEGGFFLSPRHNNVQSGLPDNEE